MYYFLGIVFVILKLTGVIDWSWLWVLLPFFIPSIIAIGGVVAAFFAIFIIAAIRYYKKD